MTKEEWLKIPEPSTPLEKNKVYRGAHTVWSNGAHAYFTVRYV